MSRMERCLHCAGDGTEPFTDEKCRICLGEEAVPVEINQDYYRLVSDALEIEGRTQDTGMERGDGSQTGGKSE